MDSWSGSKTKPNVQVDPESVLVRSILEQHQKARASSALWQLICRKRLGRPGSQQNLAGDSLSFWIPALGRPMGQRLLPLAPRAPSNKKRPRSDQFLTR